jgi:hypothetical protein
LCKKPWLILVCLALSALTFSASPRFGAEAYLRHIRYLASDNLKGRANGSPELNQAAEYIAKQFRAAGLKPAGDNATFLQIFGVATGSELGSDNKLAIRAGAQSMEAALRREFVPIATSAGAAMSRDMPSGAGDKVQLSGPVVFAGYGISAEEFKYDDYKDLVVTDKIILVLAHEPRENDDTSPFSGKLLTMHGQDNNKALNAKYRQAKAILIVQDPANHPDASKDLADPTLGAQIDELGIAAFRINRGLAQKILDTQQKDLLQLQKQIDETLTPQSFALNGVEIQITLDVRRLRQDVRNVVGILPANDPAGGDEEIVIGAHYDHLGLGNRSSMEPALIGQVHNGADDNASGTAGVIELAAALAKDPAPRKRSYVFIAFAAEELGLNGSSYWVSNPNRTLDKVVAMLNLDMIGRSRDDVVLVSGTGTSPAFAKLVENAASEAGLKVKPSPGGFGGSDQQSFYIKNIPVLFFLSGVHADYHRPTDDVEKINAAGALKILDMVYLIAAQLNGLDPRPAFTKVNEPTPPQGGGRGGYGAYFGSVPDMTEEVAGVRFADVRPNSPAANAGLRAQDVMIRFAGKEVKNLQDFNYVLQTCKPGETVEVVALRDGKAMTVQVTLAVRR